MSRSELYNARDLTYSAEHRRALPRLYDRIGHRADAADRDWTEFCHFCWQTLGIFEEVRDRGQNLADKQTGVTHRLAAAASVPAGLIAWRTDRPPGVQKQMDALHRELRAMEARHPMTGFTVRALRPVRSGFEKITPEEHWRRIALLHAEHEVHCPSVPQLERQRLHASRRKSRLELFSPLDVLSAYSGRD